MALRAAACGLFSRRAAAVCGARTSGVTVAAARSIASRAFMSTSSSELFSAPSFPVKTSPGFEGTDPSVWLENYAKADPADLWAIGSFPMQHTMGPLAGVRTTEEFALDGSLLSAEEMWDTSGMLSALADPMPLRDGAARGVEEILDEMDNVYGYYADSVLKKRRKKMNKHKHRKRKKAQRMRTKKN